MRVRSTATLFLIIALGAFMAAAQTTEFTYQGRMTDGGNAPTGLYDFEFKLFDAATGGTQLGMTQQLLGVSVAGGVFTVQLNFGSQFTGAPRYLEIAVKNLAGPFTPLAPRQQISSTPYAVRSLNSAAADDLSASCVACVNAANISSVNGSSVAGAIPVASVPAGSGSYIQNQNASPQASSNFHVSGTGTANILSATTQFNIGTSRVLAVNANGSTYLGTNAGTSNTGMRNSFFGSFAGNLNSAAINNSFFGWESGRSNVSGTDNTFFGAASGHANTASNNSFFGSGSGLSNTSGQLNSFFGALAGDSNTTGSENTFVGARSGGANSTGASNTFVGKDAGLANLGSRNAFFGTSAGAANTTAGDNAFFGNEAGLSNTQGDQNAFFGREAGRANVLGNANSFFGSRAGWLNTSINNSFFGADAGRDNLTGNTNSFFGISSGVDNQDGDRNSFFGASAGSTNVNGSHNTAIGYDADVGTENLEFATAIGALSTVSSSNSIVLGRPGGEDTVRIPGNLQLNSLATGGATPLCRTGLTNLIATCTSSSLRYKTNVIGFSLGLNVVERLRPVKFNWKDGSALDVGLIAEEVAAIEPLLAVRNEKGEIEGVKYDRIGVVLINAVKEQQKQIEEQQKQIDEQRTVRVELEQQKEQSSQDRRTINLLRSEIQMLKAAICRP